MITVTRTTYDPLGELFASTTVKVAFYGTVENRVAGRVEEGWTQTDVNQVAMVDEIGFLDVITYEDGGRNEHV